MIADKIESYLMGEGQPVPPGLLDVAAAHVRRSLARNFGERAEYRARVPSPSSKSYCARRQVYDALPMAEHREGDRPRARITFTLGDSVEAVGMLLARQAGVKFITPDEAGEQLRLKVTIDPKEWGIDEPPFEIAGNMDCTFHVDGNGETVADWKSMSEYGFDDALAAAKSPSARWWKEQEDDYIAQVRWYMLLLRVSGRGEGKFGYLLPVNKSTGAVCEIRIPHDRDAEVMLVRKAAYVWKHLRAIAGDKPLETASVEDALRYVQASVPRPSWFNTILLTGSNERGDGTKGPVVQVDTIRDKARHGSGPFVGFRCSYCPFTQACLGPEGYVLVPLGKPVLRRPATPEEMTRASS